jgi:hypothetical protein
LIVVVAGQQRTSVRRSVAGPGRTAAEFFNYPDRLRSGNFLFFWVRPTPTSASWLNAVEGFFSTITRRRIRRGVFKSVPDLQDAIRHYIREHNQSSKPFRWTKPAYTLLAKLTCLPVPSE